MDLPPPTVATTADGTAVYGFRVGLGRTAETWARLRAAHHRTGLWPFVSPASPDDWRRHRENEVAGLRGVPGADPYRVISDLIRAQREQAQELETR